MRGESLAPQLAHVRTLSSSDKLIYEGEKDKKNLVSRRYINIKLLKTYAQKSLSVAPRLRFLILTEKDELSIEEFLIKIDMWFRLLTEETTKTNP